MHNRSYITNCIFMLAGSAIMLQTKPSSLFSFSQKVRINQVPLNYCLLLFFFLSFISFQLKCINFFRINVLFFFSSGTCINNTSVMMFKKGSFEVGCTVYPVAIKVTFLLYKCQNQAPKNAREE